ncbi:MAG TPA: response regulator [Kofleriaceae bacterium]|jgi:CheY-like chemotaxis protein|nr:response regulator [Kofleriaceae bacterium]
MSEAIKILLVDDTPENLTALEALLRQTGVHILRAPSGAAALELLLVHDVSLALLDVQMPEMDGFELAELMRGAERTKHVPIIFVTAGSRDPSRMFKGYESGAVDFLYKPIDPHILRSKVDVFLELARQRQELANALRLNELFVGVVGHDLRNPLSAVIAGAELLALRGGDDTTMRTLDRMIAAGRRMTSLIAQMLDLTRARLGSGLSFTGDHAPVDVKELVHRTVEELRGANPQRAMTIDSVGDARTTGDAERLVQLFSNLVGNALAHGDADSPIKTTVVGRDRDVAVIVHNRGVIPDELMPQLFEPFRGRSQHGRSSGLGLGMFIARQIARAHGGDITVESTPSTGTVVTVQLPRRVDGIALAPSELHEPPRSASGSPRVLLVEDEPDLRETLRDALEAKSFRVATAANGQEALLLLGSQPPPDVVIFDLAMPVLDGNGLYRKMKEDPKLANIPVLVATADPTRAPRGLVVLTKPVQIKRILDEVALLGMKRGIAS